MMSKISINFDNEEQYNNFIQSIKNEVLKDVHAGCHIAREFSWVDFKAELKEDIDKRREREDRDIRSSTIAGYNDYYPFLKEAFDVKRIDQLNIVDEEKLRNFKNDMFRLINKYRGSNL